LFEGDNAVASKRGEIKRGKLDLEERIRRHQKRAATIAAGKLARETAEVAARNQAAKNESGRNESGRNEAGEKPTRKRVANRVVQVGLGEVGRMQVEATAVVGDVVDGGRGVTPMTVAPWIDQMVTRIGMAVRRGEFERAVALIKDIDQKGLDYDPKLAQQVKLDDFVSDHFEPHLAGILSNLGLLTFRQVLALRPGELAAMPGMGPTWVERVVAFCRTRFEWHDGRLAMGPRDGYRDPGTERAGGRGGRPVNRAFVEEW
jgi:hypothetical protein